MEEERVYAYDWRDLHADLERDAYAGSYGWDNACYHAIAEVREQVDLKAFHSRRTQDEFLIPEVKELVDDPATQRWWKRIVTFDPLGMTATSPTIAATTANLNIPELHDLARDGVVVDEEGAIRTTKAAIYHCWNLPHLAERLGIAEQAFRDALFKYTNNPALKDAKVRAFLPHVGGQTVYMFGDPRKLRDPLTEVAVRVHDECNGSDVFGSDVCTCRPYLMFALRACVECAQRGGVGIVVYYRKEGRSLGEVTKYRVYNARRNQAGGDRAAKYFFQTESIAGIRDARFQTMMPDVLNWLGVERIDWLLSMSAEKYEEIVAAGIKINQRVALPDCYVPKHAFVEMTAKVMAGYHSDEMRSADIVDELRTLQAIRKQVGRLFALAEKGELTFWHVHLDKLPQAVAATVECIRRRYPDLNVPDHSRFRHFDAKRLQGMMDGWAAVVSPEERVRRLIDLVFVSVLLDAGAGRSWQYIDVEGNRFTRSEGLAAATFDMFAEGLFSSDAALKTRVNSLGLRNLTVKALQVGFQVSKQNEMVGLEGRCGLLQRLGAALDAHPDFFGREIPRPGHVLDYVLQFADPGTKQVSVEHLWRALVQGLESIWPEHLSGVRRGDVWVHNSLKRVGQPGSDLVPFHKLQQWLCLSVMEAMHLHGVTFAGVEHLTALAEYRNGGLYVDTGVLQLKDERLKERFHDVGSELVVEWRAMTVALTDRLADEVRARLGKSAAEFPLAKVLEGGTWAAGRELAYKLRDGRPPLLLRSDGTVF